MLADHWLARGKDIGAAVRLLEKGPALPLVPTEGTENLLVRVMNDGVRLHFGRWKPAKHFLDGVPAFDDAGSARS